ncbi:hypothetical protein L2E82_48957 [Cichorium intybus]|uniref:Uncharacterized protein n=1 Tax=Cichorium intybus TaxID=13427 RepID=A0ACB8Z0C9_CICIN|nr:hypothetical protein L2E82_48957 [Cichorium intybus]
MNEISTLSGIKILLNWSWKSLLRSGRESNQFNDLVNELAGFEFGNGVDYWCWNGGGDGFSVKKARELLGMGDGASSSNSLFKWVNWLPLKINCLAWKVLELWKLFGDWASVLPRKPNSCADLISILNDGKSKITSMLCTPSVCGIAIDIALSPLMLLPTGRRTPSVRLNV